LKILQPAKEELYRHKKEETLLSFFKDFYTTYKEGHGDARLLLFNLQISWTSR